MSEGDKVVRGVRRIGVIDLGPESYVQIMATKDVGADEALEWAEEIIAVQRRVRAKQRGIEGPPPPRMPDA